MWGGFNLEYGNLKNGDLEGVLVSELGETGIPKTSDGFLKINLENVYLENVYLKIVIRNQVLFTL